MSSNLSMDKMFRHFLLSVTLQCRQHELLYIGQSARIARVLNPKAQSTTSAWLLNQMGDEDALRACIENLKSLRITTATM